MSVNGDWVKGASVAERPLVLPVVVAVGTALRFFRIGQQSFWYDEAASVALAVHPVGDLALGRAKDLGNPPLFPVLLHAWISLVGADNDAVVRMLPALFGALSIAMVFVVARRLVSSSAALVTTLLFALAPFHVQLAQETRTYSLLVFVGLVSTWGLLRAFETPARARWWVVHAAATCAMLYAHYFALFLVLAQVGAVVFGHRRDRAVIARAALSFGAAACGYAAWLPALYAQVSTKGNLGRSAESWYLHVAATPFVYGFGTTLAWKHNISGGRLVAAAVGALAFCGALLAGLRVVVRARTQSFLLWWFVVPIAAPLLISVLLFPLYNVRYVVLGSIPFYMLVAVGLDSMGSWARLRAACAAAIGCAMLLSSGSYFTQVVKPNWRSAVRYVESALQPGDLLLFDADNNETAYARYATAPASRLRMMAPPAAGGDPQRFFGAAFAGAPTVDFTTDVLAAPRAWLVLSDADAAAERRYQQLFASWQAEGQTEFRGISIRLFCRTCPAKDSRGDQHD